MFAGLRLNRWAAASYYLFWQAYAGALAPGRFRRLFGPARALRALLLLLRATGFVERRGETLRPSRRGFDLYHDLERLVTYRFIEPLWGAMMREHRDPAARRGIATDLDWLRPRPEAPLAERLLGHSARALARAGLAEARA